MIFGDFFPFSPCENRNPDLISFVRDQQNFPSMQNFNGGEQEISIGNKQNISYAMKNVPYRDIYTELDRTQAYNAKMLDGALIQMMYRFRGNMVVAHRLAFFPSPSLEEFQNNPDIYLNDEIYAEITRKDIVPFPLRFDFDCRDEVVKEMHHPQSHLTLGQYPQCRIPVSAPLTPYYFLCVILRNFYNIAYHKYCDNLSKFSYAFDSSITDQEMKLIYIQLPSDTKNL